MAYYLVKRHIDLKVNYGKFGGIWDAFYPYGFHWLKCGELGDVKNQLRNYFDRRTRWRFDPSFTDSTSHATFPGWEMTDIVIAYIEQRLEWRPKELAVMRTYPRCGLYEDAPKIEFPVSGMMQELLLDEVMVQIETYSLIHQIS